MYPLTRASRYPRPSPPARARVASTLAHLRRGRRASESSRPQRESPTRSAPSRRRGTRERRPSAAREGFSGSTRCASATRALPGTRPRIGATGQAPLGAARPDRCASTGLPSRPCRGRPSPDGAAARPERRDGRPARRRGLRGARTERTPRLSCSSRPPSTSGPGRHPFKVVARVRIPLGAYLYFQA
jgi:hypothetical protein